jgi:hypothetical protein
VAGRREPSRCTCSSILGSAASHEVMLSARSVTCLVYHTSSVWCTRQVGGRSRRRATHMTSAPRPTSTGRRGRSDRPRAHRRAHAGAAGTSGSYWAGQIGGGGQLGAAQPGRRPQASYALVVGRCGVGLLELEITRRGNGWIGPGPGFALAPPACTGWRGRVDPPTLTKRDDPAMFKPKSDQLVRRFCWSSRWQAATGRPTLRV